jgi:hypothetical protein
MNSIRPFTALAVSLVLFSLSSMAPGGPLWAQHDDDVLFSYENNRITFLNGGVSFLDANRFFEAEFGTTGILDRYAGDPGFESFPSFIGSNDQITFNLLPSRFGTYLTAWDPVSNSILTNHAYGLTIDSASFSLDVTASSGGSQLLGSAAANGYFHIHPDVLLSANAPQGAYGLLMTLQTNAAGIENSEPFWVIFNYGLDDPVFDRGIAAMIGVPEPGTGLVWLGLVLAAGLRRQRD